MRRKTKEKMNRLINIGILCWVIMLIFAVILIFQKRYFWALISFVGMMVGIVSLKNLKKEMKSIKNINSHDNSWIHNFWSFELLRVVLNVYLIQKLRMILYLEIFVMRRILRKEYMTEREQVQQIVKKYNKSIATLSEKLQLKNLKRWRNM